MMQHSSMSWSTGIDIAKSATTKAMLRKSLPDVTCHPMRLSAAALSSMIVEIASRRYWKPMA